MRRFQKNISISYCYLIKKLEFGDVMSDKNKRRSRKYTNVQLLIYPETHPIIQVFLDPEISKISSTPDQIELTFTDLKYLLLDKEDTKCPDRLRNISPSKINKLRFYKQYQHLHKELQRLVEFGYIQKEKRGKYSFSIIRFNIAKGKTCPIDLQCKEAPICFEKFMDYILPIIAEIADDKKKREEFLISYSLMGM
jgi:hypothetical protein